MLVQVYKRVQYTSHCHKFQFSPSIHIHINTTIQHNMQFCFAVDTQLHLPQVLVNIFSQQSNTQFVYLWFHCIYNTRPHINYQNICLTRLSFISHYNNPINRGQTLNLNSFSLSSTVCFIILRNFLEKCVFGRNQCFTSFQL